MQPSGILSRTLCHSMTQRPIQADHRRGASLSVSALLRLSYSLPGAVRAFLKPPVLGARSIWRVARVLIQLKSDATAQGNYEKRHHAYYRALATASVGSQRIYVSTP